MEHVRRVGEWLDAEVGADRVMMSVTDGNYLGMTAVGARIWDLLGQVSTVDGLCRELTRQYDVDPAACRAEVRAFLDELAALGAVTFDPPA